MQAASFPTSSEQLALTLHDLATVHTEPLGVASALSMQSLSNTLQREKEPQLRFEQRCARSSTGTYSHTCTASARPPSARTRPASEPLPVLVRIRGDVTAARPAGIGAGVHCR